MSEIDGFTVTADRDGDLYITCPETDPWCSWEPDIPNGTSLAELRGLAQVHIDEKHRVIEGETP